MTKLEKNEIYDRACRAADEFDCRENCDYAALEDLAKEMFMALLEITEKWDELTSEEEV